MTDADPGVVDAVSGGFADQRVLVFTPELTPTGGPKSVFDLSRGLREEGASVSIVALAGGALLPLFEEAGVPVVLCERRRLLGLPGAGLLLQALALLRAALRFGPTAVYANTAHCFFAVWMAWLSRIPVVWCIRESERPRDRRVRATFALRPQVAFVATATRDVWAPWLGDSPARVLPNGVDRARVDALRAGCDRDELRARMGIPPGAHLISIIGTTCERKGQHVFLDAVVALQRERPEAALHFQLVGAREGEYLRSLRARAEAASYPDRIHFVPECVDALEYFVAADLVCCCSFVESHPRVVLEAMAFSTPQVATRVFGIPEQLEEGDAGLLVEAGDASALAVAIGRLLDDPGEAAQLAARARAVYEARFTSDRAAARWRQLFAELWGLSSPSAAAASGSSR